MGKDLRRNIYHEFFDPCAETLVLLSALRLADENCEGGLKKFWKSSKLISKGSLDPVVVIKSAVNEIVRGVHNDNSKHLRQQWEYEIIALLVNLALQDILEYGESCDSREIPVLLCDYPPISVPVMIEVVKECNAYDGLNQVLLALPLQASLHVLSGVNSSWLDKRSVKDYALVIKLFSLMLSPLHGLALRSLSCESSPSRMLDVVAVLHELTFHLTDFMQTFPHDSLAECTLSEHTFAEALSAALNLSLLQTTQSALICDMPTFVSIVGALDVLSLTLNGRNYPLEKEVVQRIILDEVNERMKSAIHKQLIAIDNNAAQLLKEHLYTSEFLERQCLLLSNKDLRTNTNAFLKVAGDPSNVPFLTETRWCESFILNSYLDEICVCLQDMEEFVDSPASKLSKSLKLCARSIQPAVPLLNPIRSNNLSPAEETYFLSRVLFILGEQFPNSMNATVWLLVNSRLYLNIMWICAVEKCTHSITSSGLLCRLYDVLAEISSKTDDRLSTSKDSLQNVHARLKAVVFECFRSFDDVKQHAVMIHVFTKDPPCADVFSSENTEFLPLLMERLNKLVSTDKISDYSFSTDIGQLAMTSPQHFLSGVVRQAQQSETQAVILGEVLMSVSPVLLCTPSKINPPLFFDLILYTVLVLNSSKSGHNLQIFLHTVLNSEKQLDCGTSYSSYVAQKFVSTTAISLFDDLFPKGEVILGKLECAFRAVEVMNQFFKDMLAAKVNLDPTPLVLLLCKVTDVYSLLSNRMCWYERGEIKYLLRQCCYTLQEAILSCTSPPLCKADANWFFKRIVDLKRWELLVILAKLLKHVAFPCDQCVWKISPSLSFGLGEPGGPVVTKAHKTDMLKFKSDDWWSLLILTSLNYPLASSLVSCLEAREEEHLPRLYEVIGPVILKILFKAHSTEWIQVMAMIKEVFIRVYHCFEGKSIVGVCPLLTTRKQHGSTVLSCALFSTPGFVDIKSVDESVCDDVDAKVLIVSNPPEVQDDLAVTSWTPEQLAMIVAFELEAYVCLIAIKVCNNMTKMSVHPHQHVFKAFSTLLQTLCNKTEATPRQVKRVLVTMNEICQVAACVRNENEQDLIHASLVSLLLWCKIHARKIVSDSSETSQVLNRYAKSLPSWLEPIFKKVWEETGPKK